MYDGVYSLCRSMRSLRVCMRKSSSRIVPLVRCSPCCLQARCILTYLKVLIDFMVRQGYLTPENEPRYLEITQRLHGQFDLERW
jgi:hypothetical protein